MMMNIRRRFISVLMFALCLFSACDKTFNDLNTDPNRPKEATPGVLLSQLQYRIVTSKMNEAKSFTHILMQVQAPRANPNINSVMRWDVRSRDNIWESYYAALLDTDDLYGISKRLEQPNYMGIALVLKAYMYSILTDAYGDIPCLEATKGMDKNFLPKFDKQQVVYEQMLNWLTEANTLFETDKPLAYGGDLIFDAQSSAANMLKWKKFANSLKLRLLVRIQGREAEMKVRSKIEEILNKPKDFPVFESNADEAILAFPGNFPYFNPYYNSRTFDWRDNDYFTTFFIKTLNETNDPRLKLWARTVKKGDKAVFQGIPSAYPLEQEFDVNANSNLSDVLKTFSNMGILQTYAEVEFMKAELALKNYKTNDTEENHYNNAILASLKQWKVDIPEDFLKHSIIKYKSGGTVDEKMEQIFLQKYYASFFVDYQSWFEYRRTGYPKLEKGPGIPSSRTFPTRIPYPTYLQSLNAENLKAAVQQMGGDDCTIKVWWDNK
ncbi:SusD/RagB family nutrient-binding outer membrane lipoprotein [Sphingobacterium sp.]|uniref:SusD/RagB family nutrient-binding outer membrane lipoprotein n=1 Tax=Sphingobacterium sp. TaxID=341027 RepID=UPI002896E674|nr:SusD/RagB family nutrient-binding outer membrane lipoprotein [Sphingobacterium sp.]